MNLFDIALVTIVVCTPLFVAIFAIVQTFPKTLKAFDKKLSQLISGAEQ